MSGVQAALRASQEASKLGDSKAYDALEGDFQEVLQELASDKGLERFRIEYEKLYRALKKSHDNEKRLVKKCRELNTEIVGNAAKVQTALKLSEEDQQTIVALKKEIEKAWKMVDASHEKEAKAKEAITQLKAEIANLTRLAEAGSALSMGEEATLNELMKQRDELTRERDAQVEQILTLRSDLMDAAEKLRRAESDKQQAEADIASQKQQIAEKKSEAEREGRRRERLEREVRDLKAQVEAKNMEVRTKQLDIAGAEEQVARLEGLVKEAKGATDKVQKEFNALSEKVSKLHHDLEEAVHTNTQLLADSSSKQVELRGKEEELAALRVEMAKVVKVKDATMKKMKSLEDAKEAVESERDGLKATVASLKRDVDAARQAASSEQKKLDELAHERDILNKLRTQADSATQKQVDLVRMTENTKRNLEQEVAAYRAEAQRSAKQLVQLEKEREKYSLEASEANARYMQALNEVKVREVALVELQKRITDGDGRLKQQQALYEAVRADRNMYSKSLIEAQDEISEMKRKFKIMGHQIEQLKEELSAKDLALVKEHFDHMKVEKEKEGLRMELNKARNNIGEAESAIATQKAQLEKLNHVVAEADAERVRQKKELDLVLGERDILGTQLIRRNDELALLYEKVKIQQSTLSRGQLQYRDRLNEIRVLKIKLADLKRELHVLRTGVANVDVLKREVASLGRQLLQERTKVRALGEELENPLNVHRWRKLEGSDPSTYEMIQKIQTLQKRLISKTEEAVEKDLLIQEKEKLYVELKGILARQPGPEVAEQLSIYQASLRDKTKQLKAMASELNMYQAQVAEYKYEIERLTRELAGLKKKYYQAKKREQLDKEAARGAAAAAGALGSAAGLMGMLGAAAAGSGTAGSKAAPGGQQQQSQQQRFAGGGFSLSTVVG
uniref:Cilia- and flagella-associated protein 58 central coiled coil domain-containing protein n=1 Tax=Tetradesmus obliquus TaxID=3088 RepID=A0A383VEV0_TETOB